MAFFNYILAFLERLKLLSLKLDEFLQHSFLFDIIK
jgi:hypothetical protein